MEPCSTAQASCPLATEIAHTAVKEVFFLLGVDVDEVKSIEDFREDLRFGGKLRKLADSGITGLIGLLVIGMGTVLWLGFMALIKRG